MGVEAAVDTKDSRMRTKIKLEIAWIPGQSSETAFMPTSLPFMPAHFTDFAFKTQAIEEILADKPLALPSASLGSNSVHELGFYDIAFLTGQGCN